MKPIITLTLSPAFDLHCFCSDFLAERENLATVQSYDAGGKGINISRALRANGIDSLALTLLGEDNAAAFAQLLDTEGIRHRDIPLPGRIRENITLHTDGGKETRISFNSFSANDAVLNDLESMILAEVGTEQDFYLTLTGRVPEGISMHALKQLLVRMKVRGARLVIDSKSFSTEDILEVRPWLIKPNEEEIAQYSAHAVITEADAIDAITALHKKGIDHVLLTRGGKGALLACADGILHACVPKIEPLSTIGAGDSTIAGFLAAHQQGDDLHTSLLSAVSFGSAACLTEGTKPPQPDAIARIRTQGSVKKR